MRRNDREITRPEEIQQILDHATVLRLGLFDGEYPYIVPLHFGYECEGGRYTFYMHGAREGHKLDLIRSGNKACIETDCDIELVSGGDVACNYGSLYASVIAGGTVELLEEPSEKVHGLKCLMLHQTGREFDIRESMAEAVAVIRFTADFLTAKAKRKP